MLLKFLLLYNLILILVLEFTSLKSIESAPGIIYSLLLLPLVYHFGVELVRPAKRFRPAAPITLFKTITPQTSSQSPSISGQVIPAGNGVSDRDRRLFLKLIGSTGLSLFFMSLVSKEAQATFFGSMPGPGTVALKDSTGTAIDPAIKQPTDGYKISQLDDSSSNTYLYFGFVDKNGSWYIQRETISGVNSGDYRYYKGSTDFAANWGNRSSLAYDDFEDIF